MDKLQQSVSRAKWAHPAEFLLSCIGYSVGLGNVWRFPYLCYKNGGAPFIIVYLFLQLTIGKPLYFMELAVAQYAGKGPVKVWDLNPAARGIGLSMCVISILISLYYNVIMAYILYYFFAAFFPDLPWQVCKKEWGDICYTDPKAVVMSPECKPDTKVLDPCTCSGDPAVDTLYPNCSQPLIHAAELFFNKEVLLESENLADFGYPSWKLALLLLLSWIIVFACMIKGIKSTGKVVYFTATFPYVLLLLLLVRGATLDGAVDGVKSLFIPDWTALGKMQLWIDATGQMFFSLGLSMGGILMFGSYNCFHHPVYRDALIISSMDLFTSLLASLVIFTTFGYAAKQSGLSIFQVAESGYGLAFVAYPQTLGLLSLPNLWSVMFFFMLYTLGLDSQFALLETMTSYLIDDFVWCRGHKTLLRLVFSAVLYVLGLSLVCPGGQYLINMIDVYGSSYPLSIISLLELISIMWIYGVKRFLADLGYMMGRKPALLPYWYFVWVFWSPLFLTGQFFFVVGLSETPTYTSGKEYGPVAMAMCWLVYCLTLVSVPFWFFLHLRATHRKHGYTGFIQLCRDLFAPLERWGPADGSGLPLRSLNTVWADVLDWPILRQVAPTVTVTPDRVGNTVAPANNTEGAITTVTVTPAKTQKTVTTVTPDSVGDSVDPAEAERAVSPSPPL